MSVADGVRQRLADADDRLIGGAAAVVSLVLPFLLTNYYTGVATEAIVFGLFAVAVNVALGYAGLITLAPAAYFGIGAYAVAKVVVDFGGSFWTGLVLAVVLAAVAAVAVAYVPIRQRIGAVYFALFTMAFGVIVHDFTYVSSGLTGGSNGLGYVSPPSVFGLDLSGTVPYYYFTLLVTGLLVAGLYGLLHSDYGLVLHATRQNELRMRYLGYDTDREKLTAWLVSCVVSAVAGALYVGVVGLAAPTMLSFELTGEALIWVVVGGVGTLVGPFVAAFGLTVLEELVGSVWPEGYLIVLGALFVAFVFLLPTGIVGWLQEE